VPKIIEIYVHLLQLEIQWPFVRT